MVVHHHRHARARRRPRPGRGRRATAMTARPAPGAPPARPRPGPGRRATAMTARPAPGRAPRTASPGDAALRYATHGWAVLPLHTPSRDGFSCGHAACPKPGKHPRIRHGLGDATIDP